MKVIDTVKAPPKTALDAWLRWSNRISAQLRSMPGYGQKIEVTERYNCAECGIETDYWKFGEICGKCEAKSELGML